MNERFDDEVISAVLEGDADEETTAAVMADPVARQRLNALRSVQSLVASAPPAATPERRSASIAAALAEARTEPVVTPLAPTRVARARQWRPPVEWVAAVAAVVVLVLAVPLIGNLTAGDDADTTSAGDAIDLDDAGSDGALSSRSESALLSDSDAVSEEAAPALTTTSVAAAGAADVDSDDMAATDDAGDAGDAGDAESDTADTSRQTPVVNSEEVLASFLEDGIIGPVYFASDPEIVEAVNPACLEPFSDADEAFALVLLTPSEGPDQLVLVHFSEDGTTTTLDAEDCTTVG